MLSSDSEETQYLACVGLALAHNNGMWLGPAYGSYFVDCDRWYLHGAVWSRRRDGHFSALPGFRKSSMCFAFLAGVLLGAGYVVFWSSADLGSTGIVGPTPKFAECLGRKVVRGLGSDLTSFSVADVVRLGLFLEAGGLVDADWNEPTSVVLSRMRVPKHEWHTFGVPATV